MSGRYVSFVRAIVGWKLVRSHKIGLLKQGVQNVAIYNIIQDWWEKKSCNVVGYVGLDRSIGSEEILKIFPKNHLEIYTIQRNTCLPYTLLDDNTPTKHQKIRNTIYFFSIDLLFCNYWWVSSHNLEGLQDICNQCSLFSAELDRKPYWWRYHITKSHNL